MRYVIEKELAINKKNVREKYKNIKKYKIPDRTFSVVFMFSLYSRRVFPVGLFYEFCFAVQLRSVT